MNNKDFEKNLIAMLLFLGVSDYVNRTFIINPIFEEQKCHNEYDDMMRHFVFPKRRKLTYHQFIKLFTIREGYYPCWIEILNVDTDIIINTSLRMRKLKETKCIGEYHPFKLSKQINIDLLRSDMI